jgi:type IX secretion system substrate protein
MKTNGTRLLLIVLFLQLILLVFAFSTKAQPDFTFANPSLISGTDRQIGAVYNYSRVKPNVDARVTITDITPGVTIVEFDATAGYLEALQPTINVPRRTRGYVELRIEFLNRGTGNLMRQPQVSATCVDVDGSLNLHEFDEINLGGGFVDYNMLGNQVTVTQNGSWFRGANVGDVEYPGRDTAATTAMFTVTNANINTAIIRVGADNQTTTSQERLRSVYFKRFTYANSFLALPALKNFRGNEKNKKVELKWDLIDGNQLAKVIIEKGNSPLQYKSVGEVWVDQSKKSFQFTDISNLDANAYYRLRMVSASGEEHLSSVLFFRAGADNGTASLSLYPSVIQSQTTVNYKAERSSIALFQVIDMSGKVVYKKNVTLQEGTNNIVVGDLNKLMRGNYIVSLSDNNKMFTQKIIKQ